MTAAELVRSLAERLGVSQRQARAVLDAYVAAITRQLDGNSAVVLRNFGSFSPKTVAEKRAYIPTQNSYRLIPAHRKLHFKPAKNLRDAISAATPDG